MTGELITGGGKAPLEIVEAAPDRFLRVIESPVSGHSENGFDGTTAWSKNPRGAREVSGPEVGMLLREHHLYRPVELRRFYVSVTPPRADTLDGRAVYAIVGTTADSVAETLYCEWGSGLLTGWDVTIAETTLRTRLDDFRKVDGVTNGVSYWARARGLFVDGGDPAHSPSSANRKLSSSSSCTRTIHALTTGRFTPDLLRGAASQKTASSRRHLQLNASLAAAPVSEPPPHDRSLADHADVLYNARTCA